MILRNNFLLVLIHLKHKQIVKPIYKPNLKISLLEHYFVSSVQVCNSFSVIFLSSLDNVRACCTFCVKLFSIRYLKYVRQQRFSYVETFWGFYFSVSSIGNHCFISLTDFDSIGLEGFCQMIFLAGGNPNCIVSDASNVGLEFGLNLITY